MNINMADAVFINAKGEKHKFDQFFIQARNVRYVHIPDEVPVIGAIEQQLAKIISFGQKKKFVDNKSFKLKRTVKKQQETVEMIAKLKEERLKKLQSKKE